MFVDTHCHIHEADYVNAEGAYARAMNGGVNKLMCVGTNDVTSSEAVAFADTHENVWSSVGVHPHDTKDGYDGVVKLLTDKHHSIVAIGEIGLDYFYTHSPREVQIEAFEAQLQLAVDNDLPVVFHVREAFDDFWPIFSNHPGVRGVLHSFTDGMKNLEQGLASGLYIGVNGISTFAKTNQDVWDAVPLERMLLETDAPYLTPVPHRGTVNEPAFVKHVAEYHAERRRVELEHLARVTSANASNLFSL